jgi:primosomal protein N'
MIAECLIRQKTGKIQTFDYIFDPELKIEINSLVLVPFLNKKVEAIVVGIKSSSSFAKKNLIKKISAGPIVTDKQLKISKLIAEEFFSDFSSCLFSFLPKLNKRDLVSLGGVAKISVSTKKRKPIMLTADSELRQNYYFQKIDKTKQNLIILPEIKDIANFKLLAKRLDPSIDISIWHSGIGSGKKAAVLKKLLAKEPTTIVSTRHGIFLPYTDLDLVIVDDPANFAYFEDQSPRYNAMRASKIVSQVYNAELIYGDSILSPETFAWIKSEKAIHVKINSNLKIKSTVAFSKIFSDENFMADYTKAKKILITGFFKNYQDFYCHDCGSQVDVDKGNVSCQVCSSIRLKKQLLDLNSIKSMSEKVFKIEPSFDVLSKSKVVISSINELPQNINNFDLVIVPYFDYFTSFPFLNFKFKLIKKIFDLKQIGAQSIYLCSREFNHLADRLENSKLELVYYEELKERKKDALPPFARVVELIGDESDLKKLEPIIPANDWILSEKKYLILSHDKLKQLQNFYQQEKLDLKLRLDPPEFA